MSGPLLLALDCGTQSVRALLFDPTGRLVARSQVSLPTPDAPRPGWAELDPTRFWDHLADACRQLWADSGQSPDAVAGVALCTQRATIVLLDEQGRPLRPAILWMDRRRTEGLAPVGGLWGLLFRLARLRETVAYFQAEAEVNWIRRHEPEIWTRTAHVMLLSGYLTHRLTGRYVDSVAAQVGYIPFDYKERRWAGPHDWKWQVAPIERRMLPTLVTPTRLLGTITPAAAAATGIPAGLPLIAAGADKACEVIGSGALEPGIGALSYGTAATINAIYPRYVEVVPHLPPYPAILPDAYSCEIQIAGGYWMVRWFVEQFGHPERRRAAEQAMAAEPLLESLIEAVPAGSDGLLLQPYWFPGLRHPGPEARGAVIGFGDQHTRAHLYRAIIEGIGYALREGAERIEARGGVPIRELRVAGGGSQSNAAMQITADLFGRPAHRPHTYEASGLGAAMAAAVGLGLHADIPAAVTAMSRSARRFDPDPERHALYSQLYSQLYRPLYGRLQPLYERLQEIVGPSIG